MKTVKLIDHKNAREVTLDAVRAQTVLREIRRVSGSLLIRFLWLLFGFLLKRRYRDITNRAAPDLEIRIENGSTRIYEVYARSILLNGSGRAMQFYMGILLQEWLEP